MSRLDLSRLVDLAAQLEADVRVDPDALRRRDRTLGRALTGTADDATERVQAWLDARLAGAGQSPGTTALRGQRVLRALLTLAGAVAGAGAAGIVFAYDGTHPVNVVQALAFFVLLQALLLVATLLLLLPARCRRYVPGLRALQDVLALASPGRWQPLLQRLLPAAQRHALERAAGLARRHQRLYGDVQKWSWAVSSQLFAVSFHVGALAAALMRVGVSDLAFGWSTTLELDAALLERACAWLAAPWSYWLPQAVPDRELIDGTRYFRGGLAPLDPERSRGWWRFLLACMACYGLLPRLGLLALCDWRQRAALRRAFDTLPGVAELQDRLQARWVSTAGEEEAVGQVESGGAGARVSLPRPDRVQVVRWSGLPLDDAGCARAVSAWLRAECERVLDGGAGSGCSDAELLELLATSPSDVAWLVKAWEPPLGELLDLLGATRERLGGERNLFVLPVCERGARSRGHERVWMRSLDGLGDPRLEVVAGAELP